MKVLILGGSGMLGHKLVQGFNDKFEVWTTIRGNAQVYKIYGFLPEDRVIEDFNALDDKKLIKSIESVGPEVIINAVGVVKQLPISKDLINTLEINSILPHKLKEISEQNNIRLINVGTDCVFKGSKGNYNETDEADAGDLYGRSKNLGEVSSSNCLTLRTSIIGRELFSKHSLVEWFLSNKGKKIKGFKNAVFSGFSTLELTAIIGDLIINHPNLEGLYHVSGFPINKFDLLNLLRKAFKLEIEIEPNEDFVIDRSLDSTKFRNATGYKPKSWEEMVWEMGNDLTAYQKY